MEGTPEMHKRISVMYSYHAIVINEILNAQLTSMIVYSYLRL